MKKWKVAVVGAGYMAQEHAKALSSIDGVELVGFCGRARQRAEALANAHGVPVYRSITEMFAVTQADAVVVTVNELSVPDVCAESFRFPWVCLLEKPVGVNLQVARRIVEDSHSANARAFVAFNRRSYSATRQALHELEIDDGPRLISVLDQEDQNAARAAGQPEEVVRNWMYANSIHLIDYFSFMARGDVVSIEHAAPWTPESPCFVAATIRFSSGDVGIYQAVWNAPGPWSVTVTNRKVRLEMRPVERLAVQRLGERRLTEIEPEPVDIEHKPGLRYQAEQLISVLEGRKARLATLDDSMRSMELCAKIYGLAPAS
jgi:predicted dehydrogenase